MRRLLVLVMLGSLFAGCTSSDGPDLMSAKQALSPANRAADRWADDAALVSAEAQELDDAARREFGDELDEESAELRELRDEDVITEELYDTFRELLDAAETIAKVNDDDVGDGRASLWSFTYVSADEADAYMVIVAHGRVIYKSSASSFVEAAGADDFDMDDFGEPLDAWSVDSTTATQTAALGNEDYTRLCDSKDVSAYLYLEEGNDGPIWFLGVESQEEGSDDEVFLAVDAINGSLVRDEVLDPITNLVYQESGRLAGIFNPSVDETQSDSFEVLDERHLQFAVQVRVSPPPAQPLTVTVTDPLGVKTELVVEQEGVSFVAFADRLVDGAPLGTYAVEVNVPVSVRNDWSVSWCTDGVPSDQDDLQNSACAFFEGATPPGGSSEAQAETLSPLGRWLGAWDL